ncbi:MAG: phosphoribosylformylglycinamidine cyclo-ligase, partial [Alphaproteobacteria bacterium]|nr:phosphoribosylformylglycinamidine cyclo-ligase [Alphaproteobacteria bacterium]
EMPGMYTRGEYDLAGFAVGAVERDRLLTGASVEAGDIVLGLSSNGLHSNGFSLVRNIIERSGADLAAPAPFAPGQTLGAALLAPTRIYVGACLAALKAAPVRALAHITGGGPVENLPRVLPDGLGVRLDAARWPLPPVFSWLAAAGGLSANDLANTFNCGIGMAVIVPPAGVDAARRAFETAGETVFAIGEVAADTAAPVEIANTGSAWTTGEA